MQLRYWFRLLGNIKDRDLIREVVEELGGSVQEVADRESMERMLEEDCYRCGVQQGSFFATITFDEDVIIDAVSAYDMLEKIQDRITKKGISRTYQNIRLFPAMTALENILVGAHPKLKSNWVDALLHTPRQRAEEKEALQKAQELLNFVELKGKGDLLARNLPYGEQRRLEMARALANDPKIILLDEPTAGMNPNESRTMMRFIEKLRDELGITILLIEHDMKVVMGISEFIYVLDFGQLIAKGTPSEIQKNPQVIESYLGRGAAG